MSLLEYPTDEQRALREAYDETHHVKLAGPVRPFVRQFEGTADEIEPLKLVKTA